MTLWRILTAGLALALALVFATAPAGLRGLQERIFDTMVTPAAAPPEHPVVVVDIGAVDDKGLPWTREATARLVAELGQSAPRVIGFDMLFAGECTSMAALALARAMADQPVVLGFLLMDGPGPDLPPSALGLAGPVALWPAAGADAPCPLFARADWAMMALLGDQDALVRRAPVGAMIGSAAYPGLAVQIAARALEGQAIAGPDWLHLAGGQPIATENGFFRVPASGPAVWAARRLDAADVLAGRVGLPKDAVVLVGSSLPQRGGLRPTATSPLAPSVQILADGVIALMTGRVPARPVWAKALEAGFVALMGLATLWLVSRRRPGRATAALGAVGALWVAGTLGLAQEAMLLIDPILPLASAGLVLLMAVTGRAAQAARAEGVLRGRMGQFLPATVVTRLANEPDLMRLEGEMREVTALFSDIEDFTKATSQMGAQEMVARLEAYFALTCAIVLRHGGMIDKLVGDSIHALFNAPLDQPGHEAAALACAVEMIAATEAFRRQNGGFGRTRIGLECGAVVLGDVGFGTRIDYTAHGPAVNLAARLQETNKIFGSQICIGPALADRLPGLTPLGQADIRSFGLMTLHTVKP